MPILEPSISQVTVVPDNGPYIYDGMVLLQKLPPNLTTFGDVSDYLLQKLVKGKGSARSSFFVTDHYVPDSIKAMERERRSNVGTLS